MIYLKSTIMNRATITQFFSNEVLSLINNHGRFFLEGSLVNKELSVFDKYEIKKMGNGFRYIVLKIEDLGKVQFKHISRIVNTLYLMYGEDDYGRGKFSDLDIFTLGGEKNQWDGRSWLNNRKYVHPAMIRFDDVEGFRLFVMNV